MKVTAPGRAPAARRCRLDTTAAPAFDAGETPAPSPGTCYGRSCECRPIRGDGGGGGASGGPTGPSPSTCTMSLSRTTVPANATGATGTVNVMTANGCPWTVASNAEWIRLTSGTSGTGAGRVAFTIDDNPTIDVRTGTISIGHIGKEIFSNLGGGGPRWRWYLKIDHKRCRPVVRAMPAPRPSTKPRPPSSATAGSTRRG